MTTPTPTPPVRPNERRHCRTCPALLGPIRNQTMRAVWSYENVEEVTTLAPILFPRDHDGASGHDPVWIDVHGENFFDLVFCYGGSVRHRPVTLY